MLRRLLVTCCLLAWSGVAHAGDVDSLASRTAIDLSLTLSQNSYSNNWVGGDAGNLAWIALGSVTRQDYLGPAWHWRNTLNLGYGQTHSQDPDTKRWQRPRKSTDKIDFESLMRYLRFAAFPPYASVRAISQFEDATFVNHKLYVNPIQLTEAAGLSRQLYKAGDDELLTRAGFGLRQLIQRSFDDTTNFDKTSTATSTDGGVEWVTDASYKIPGSSIGYKGKLTTFKALYYSKSKDLRGKPNANYWKAIDVNWENTFSAQVSKYIVVSLNLQWLYDKDIDLGGRFKQTLSIGLAWKNL